MSPASASFPERSKKKAKWYFLFGWGFGSETQCKAVVGGLGFVEKLFGNGRLLSPKTPLRTRIFPLMPSPVLMSEKKQREAK